MKEQEFEYNPIMYPIAILGFITGNIVGGRFTDISWLPWIIYLFASFSLLVSFLRHRSIVIDENSIRIKELLRGEKTILKSEVENYRSTFSYRKTPFTTWYFRMKNGKEIILSHDYMKNEKELTEVVNEWSSTIPMAPSA